MRQPIFLLAALCLAAGCRDFSLAVIPGEAPPAITSVEGAADPLAGYWRDRVLLRGTNLGADLVARFEPEGLAGVLVESNGERVVFEVPDLGDAGPRTLRISSPRVTTAEGVLADYAFEFLGAGQPRSGRVVESLSLASPFLAMEAPFVPASFAPTAGSTAYEQTLREIEQIRSETFFALSPSDFVVSVGLQANLFTVAAELDRIVLASSALAFPMFSQGTWVPAGLLVSVDWDGYLHLRSGFFARATPDFGWIFVANPVTGDDRLLGGASLLASYPLAGRDLEVETVFLEPAGGTAVARLAVLVRQAPLGERVGRASAWLLELDQQGGQLSVTAKELEARPAPGTLAAVVAGDKLLVSGIAPKLEARPQMLYELRADALGRPRLDEVLVEGDLTLEAALEYPGGTALQQPSLSASACAALLDGSRVAVSFGYEVEGSVLPRMVMLSRSEVEPGRFRIERTQSGAAFFPALAFARHADGDALYGLEGISGRLVRLSSADLQLQAGFSAGEGATPIALGAARDGRRLLVSTLENGELLQFDTSSETFLLPLVRELHFGALEAFDGGDGEALIVAYNSVKSAATGSLPLPGEVAIVQGGVPVHLGAEPQAGGSVRAGIAIPHEQSLLLMVSTQAGHSAGIRASRITSGRLGDFQIQSERCESPWLLDGFAAFPALGRVLALASAADGRSNEKRLLAVDFAGQLEGREAFCESLATVAESPIWRSSELDAACHGSLAPLPDGRTAIRWAPDVYVPGGKALEAGCSQLSLVGTDGSIAHLQLDDVAVVRPLPWARAPVAVDARGCAPSFKPAIFTAVDGGIATAPVDQLDESGACGGPWAPAAEAAGAGCRGGAPAGVGLFCTNLGDLLALAVSPNGRRLYAVADRAGSRLLVEIEIDRDAAGSVVGLRSGSETRLGETAAPSQDRPPEPAGLAFSEKGATLHLTVSSSAEVLTYE